MSLKYGFCPSNRGRRALQRQMLRLLLPPLLCLLGTQPLLAAELGGLLTVDQTLTAADSPHQVVSGVRVDEGVTLTIEPGVDIEMCGTCGIRVDGTLVAEGTEAAPIRFVPEEGAESWGFMRFMATSPDGVVDGSNAYVSGNILSHVELHSPGADSSFAGALLIEDASPVIRDVLIDGSLSSGIVTEGQSKTLTLTRVSVLDSASWGIFHRATFDSVEEFVIQDSVFERNLGGFNFGGSSEGYQVVIDGSVFRENGSFRSIGGQITNNHFYGNDSIRLEGGSDAALKEFRNNLFIGQKDEVRVDGSNIAVVENNIWVDNRWDQSSVSPTTDFDKAALRVSANTRVNNNVFADGEIGYALLYSFSSKYEPASAQSNSFVNNRVYYGVASYKYSTSPGSGFVMDDFLNNTLSGNRAQDDAPAPGPSGLLFEHKILSGQPQPLDVTNNQFLDPDLDYLAGTTGAFDGLDVDFSNNWWGTADEVAIDDRVLDFTLNSDLALIDVRPALTAPIATAPLAPPRNLSLDVVGPGQVSLSWDQPLGRAVTGYRVYWGTEDAPFYDDVVDVGNNTSHLLEVSGLEGTFFVGVTAYDADYLASGDDANTPVNENQTGGTESWYLRGAANPLDVSPVSLDFGDVNTGTEQTRTVTITNRGYAAYEVNSLILEGTNAAAFTLTADSCTSVILEPAQSCTTDVVMAPVEPGTIVASLQVMPTATGQEERTVALAGEAIAVPRLSLSNTVIEFEPTLIAESVSSVLTIENTGTAPLSASSLALDVDGSADYQLNHSCTSINPGATCPVTITFTPSAPGAQTNELTLSTDALVMPERVIPISSEGVLPVSINSISASPLTGEIPLDVTLTGGANGGRGALSYDWSFSNGATATGASVNQSITEAGSVVATLTVSDTGMTGNESSATVTITATEARTLSVIESNLSSAMTDGLLSADFSVAAEGGSGNLDYQWDFGDGNVANGSAVSHTYAEGGEYTVTLTVEDQNDAGLSTQTEWTVLAPEPPLSLGLLDADLVRGTVPFTTQFEGQGVGGSGAYEYRWTFPDGSEVTTANASFEFTQPGTETITLTVTDANNPEVQTSGQLQVQAVEPPAQFVPIRVTGVGSSARAGTVPLPVDFSLELEGGSGDYTFEWDFGDGNTSLEQQPQHTYMEEGEYTVSVVITDTADAFNTASGEFTLLALDSPESLGVNLTVVEQPEELPAEVVFDVAIQNGSAPYTLMWEFGDGETATQDVTGNTATQTHVYQDAGSYRVALSVVTSDGTGVTSQSLSMPLGIALLAPGEEPEPDTDESPTQPEGDSSGGGGGGSTNALWLFMLLLLGLTRRVKAA